MNVLYVMSFIVEKMSMTIKIQADNLVLYLPLLWDEGSEHNMLRCAIISALVSFSRFCFVFINFFTIFFHIPRIACKLFFQKKIVFHQFSLIFSQFSLFFIIFIYFTYLLFFFINFLVFHLKFFH